MAYTYEDLISDSPETNTIESMDDLFNKSDNIFNTGDFSSVDKISESINIDTMSGEKQKKKYTYEDLISEDIEPEGTKFTYDELMFGVDNPQGDYALNKEIEPLRADLGYEGEGLPETNEVQTEYDYEKGTEERPEDQAQQELVKFDETIRRLKGYGESTAQLVESAGGGLKALGGATLEGEEQKVNYRNIVGEGLKFWGKKITDYSDKMQEFYETDATKKDFIDDVIGIIPSVSAFLIPGLTVPKIIGTAGTLAVATGVGVSTVLEAFVESGGTHEDMKAKGATDKEAQKAAGKSFFWNLAILAPSNALGGLFDDIGKAAKKTSFVKKAWGFFKGTFSEGGQEALQEVISAHAKDELPKTKEEKIEFAKRTGKAFVLGSIGGGGVATIQAASQAIEARRKPLDIKIKGQEPEINFVEPKIKPTPKDGVKSFKDLEVSNETVETETKADVEDTETVQEPIKQEEAVPVPEEKLMFEEDGLSEEEFVAQSISDEDFKSSIDILNNELRYEEEEVDEEEREAYERSIIEELKGEVTEETKDINYQDDNNESLDFTPREIESQAQGIEKIFRRFKRMFPRNKDGFISFEDIIFRGDFKGFKDNISKLIKTYENGKTRYKQDIANDLKEVLRVLNTSNFDIMETNKKVWEQFKGFYYEAKQTKGKSTKRTIKGTKKKLGEPRESNEQKAETEEVTPETNLIEEAKKYKSAEEFVESQTKFFHGTSKNIEKFSDNPIIPTFITLNKKYAEIHGKPMEVSFNPKKTFDTSINETDREFYNNKFIPFMKKFKTTSSLFKELDVGEKVPDTTADQLYNFLRTERRKGNINNDSILVKEIGNDNEYSMLVLDASQIKTKQQLTEIYNKAQETKAEKPTEPKETKEPKEKVRGLSKSIMKEAISKGLVDELGDLPTYKTRDIEGEIADKVNDFIERDPQLAKDIALLKKPEQDGLRSQELLTGLRIKALVEGDIDTIKELATNEEASATATELGQRIKALDTGLNNNPYKIIQSVIEMRKESKNYSTKEMKTLEKQLAETEKKLADYEKKIERINKKEANRTKRTEKFGENNTIFTKEVYDKAQKDLRSRLRTFSSGVDPTALLELAKVGGYYFEGGVREFRTWANTLIEDFGVGVKPYLRQAWRQMQVNFKQQKKGLSKSLKTLNNIENKSKKPLTAEKKIERAKKLLEKRIAEYERRIDQKDFSTMKKEGEKVSSPEIEELRQTLDVLKKAYNDLKPTKERTNEQRLKALKPTKERTNEQRLKAFKTRISNETTKLNKSLETLNFEKRVSKKTILDMEADILRQKRDKIKLSVNAAKSVGENITKSEVEKIVDLTSTLNEARDQIEKTGDETANNEKNVMKYWETRAELEKYVENLKPITTKDIVNNFINYMRASILASPRILRNSFIYQTIPGIERTISKRLVTGAFNDADLKSDTFEKIRAKMSGLNLSKEDLSFIKRQVAMAVKIYHKTGYDISRIDDLGQRSKYFGEKAGVIKGKGILSNIGRFVNLAPKWLAGGTDMLFSNIGRADTALMMSKEIAKIESIQGKLPKGMTEKQRASQLLRDSYQFNPKDKRANTIREAGIRDAHMMNNTQPGGWSDGIIKIRNLMTTKGVNWGKAIIPFAKIANVVIAEGTKTATGIGVAQSLFDINNASKIENIDKRAILMNEGVTNLVKYTGLMSAAALLSGLLDDDDYVGAYSTLGKKNYKIATAKGAGANMIRIGGKWIPLRYLPLINIPLSAIMTARQATSSGKNPIQGYLVGMAGQILDAPGLKEGGSILKKLGWAMRAKTPEKALSSLGFDGEGITNWAKVRMIPSVLSYDVYNAMFNKDKKYDFLGREKEKGNPFKDDKTNDVILEINRLSKTEFSPVISDPSNDFVKKVEEKMGKEKYEEYLSSLKRDYSSKVEKTINTSSYKRQSDKNKEKRLNKLRDLYIINKIKRKSYGI